MADLDYGELLSDAAGDDPSSEAMARMSAHLTRAIQRWQNGAADFGGDDIDPDRDEEGVVTVVDLNQSGGQPARSARRRWPMIAAAAVVALVTGIAVVLASGDGDDTDIGPREDPTTTAIDETPTTVTTVVPSTVPAAGASEEEFEGSWTGVFFEAEFDGDTYRLVVEGETLDEGTFLRAGGVIALTSSAASTTCAEGERAAWTYSFDDADTLTLEFESDECNLDRPLSVAFGGVVTLTRAESSAAD